MATLRLSKPHPSFSALFLVAAALCAPKPASATVEKLPPAHTTSRLSLTIAPGVANYGLVGAANVNVEIGGLRLTARGLTAGALDSGDVVPSKSLDELALLGGWAWRNERRTLYLMAGPAFVKAVAPGKFLHTYINDGMYGTEVIDYHERLVASPLSLAIEAGIMWGYYGFALVGNVNDACPTVGIVLTLELGETG